MKEKEAIPVYVTVINGRTMCICMKGCNRKEYCERDVVERDLFRGWKQTMRRDRYGR